MHRVPIDNKGKRIRTGSGSFQALQNLMFVEKVLNISDGVWDCPDRHAKHAWYSDKYNNYAKWKAV